MIRRFFDDFAQLTPSFWSEEIFGAGGFVEILSPSILHIRVYGGGDTRGVHGVFMKRTTRFREIKVTAKIRWDYSGWSGGYATTMLELARTFYAEYLRGYYYSNIGYFISSYKNGKFEYVGPYSLVEDILTDFIYLRLRYRYRDGLIELYRSTDGISWTKLLSWSRKMFFRPERLRVGITGYVSPEATVGSYIDVYVDWVDIRME